MLNPLAMKFAIEKDLSIRQAWLMALLRQEGPMFVTDIESERVMCRRSLERLPTQIFVLYKARSSKYGITNKSTTSIKLSREGRIVADKLSELSSQGI